MLAGLQRQMIYYPSRESEPSLLAMADRVALAAWRDSRGELIGWQRESADSNAATMLVFHGNAGFALDRSYFADGLTVGPGQASWSVTLFEYPGYGARSGTPSEATIIAAADQALQQLLDTRTRPVYLAGESLGSGVACALAAKWQHEIAGVFLVTPFTSLVDVAAYHYPWLPVKTLLRERYECLETLQSFPGPVAFLLAGRDEVVPTQLGQQLYDAFAGPKWLRIDAAAGHNSLDFRPTASWWRELSDFLGGNPAAEHGGE